MERKASEVHHQAAAAAADLQARLVSARMEVRERIVTEAEAAAEAQMATFLRWARGVVPPAPAATAEVVQAAPAAALEAQQAEGVVPMEVLDHRAAVAAHREEQDPLPHLASAALGVVTLRGMAPTVPAAVAAHREEQDPLVLLIMVVRAGRMEGVAEHRGQQAPAAPMVPVE